MHKSETTGFDTEEMSETTETEKVDMSASTGFDTMDQSETIETETVDISSPVDKSCLR